VLEHLETIPETNVCLRAGDYRIETRQIKDNIVKSLIIRRQSTPRPDAEDVDAKD
jgi:Mg2+/Co2+ transporter CorB